MPDKDTVLNRDDLSALKQAIVTAYPHKEDLYNELLNSWGVRVSDIIYTEYAGAVVIDRLVEWVQAQGRGRDLLTLAWQHKHKEVEPLQNLATRLLGLPAPPPHKSLFSDEQAQKQQLSIPRHELSRMVQSLHPPTFEGIKSAICRVLIGQHSRATGFLIAKDLVLTSFSAVARLIDGNQGSEQLNLHFDGVGDKKAVIAKAAAGENWLVAYSRHAPSDMETWLPAGSGSQEEADGLDFALVRLASPVGADRAILHLPHQVPVAAIKDAVFVLQYPSGRELKVTPGELEAYTDKGTRVHYTAMTEPGSAGAPVLTRQGGLIALHHAGRRSKVLVENQIPYEKLGQGVPIWRIRAALIQAGVKFEAAS